MADLGEIIKKNDGSYEVPNWEGAVNPNLTRAYLIETPTRKFIINCFSDIDAFHVLEIAKRSLAPETQIRVGEFGHGMWELKEIIEAHYIPNSRMIGSNGLISIHGDPWEKK